ncbi:MAG: primosomal replication protein [Colwellia sp.]|nr:primosomal replication protein [Colwellia sp.]
MTFWNIKVNSIVRLAAVLARLTLKAKKIDALNRQSKTHKLIENHNLFSINLFSSQSDRYIDYIEEIERRLNEFSRLITNNKIELSKVLLQRLEAQIFSVSNALNANPVIHQAAKLSFDANNKVRIKKAKMKQARKYNELAKVVMLSSHQLYQKLTEHHEFERRLMDMVSEREIARIKSKNHESKKISAEVLALHQRLGRCRKAISIIERDIELVEKR